MEKQTFVKEICPTTTQGRVKNGELLIDVREKDEVAELAYDVPNLINIPLSEFEERFSEIPKDKEVVMVCLSGGRSLRAAGFLVNHGYTNVVNMEHGMIRWATKGFPTKGDTSSVLGKTQNTGCCDTRDSSQSCCTQKVEKEKVNTCNLGECC
jgi:rhodanese-related sulfurtransferase